MKEGSMRVQYVNLNNCSNNSLQRNLAQSPTFKQNVHSRIAIPCNGRNFCANATEGLNCCEDALEKAREIFVRLAINSGLIKRGNISQSLVMGMQLPNDNAPHVVDLLLIDETAGISFQPRQDDLIGNINDFMSIVKDADTKHLALNVTAADICPLQSRYRILN